MGATDSIRILGVRTFGDELLSAVAPLGLATAAGSALVVDLDRDGPSYPGERTVAELIEEGPRQVEIHPSRSGVAVLGNGGADPTEASELVNLLAPSWPAIVLRVGLQEVPFPVIPLRPLWPGFLAPSVSQAAVWQRVAGSGEPPGPGPTLPPPGRSTIKALLAGRRPVRSRWIAGWREIWRLPWQ